MACQASSCAAVNHRGAVAAVVAAAARRWDRLITEV